MANVIVVIVVLVIIGAALVYIRKEKKRGVTCIGCPQAGMCAKKNCAGTTGGHASGRVEGHADK